MMATSGETRVAGLMREGAALAIRSQEAYRRSQEAEAFADSEEAWIELEDELVDVLKAILTAPPQSAADIALQANVIRQLVTMEEPRGLEDLKDEVLVFAENVAAWARSAAQ